MLCICSNSGTLAKVLEADIAMSTVNKKCWSDFQYHVRTLQMIPQSEFVVDVRKGLRSIWSQANQLGNEDQIDKAAKHHYWVALPLRPLTVDGPPFSVPTSICIWIWAGKHSAPWHVSGYIPIHSLCVETRSWEHHDGNISGTISVACRQFKMKTHALFLCPCMQMYSLRLQFADLFHDLPLAHKITVMSGEINVT